MDNNTRIRNFQKIQFDRLFRSKHLSLNPSVKPELSSAVVSSKVNLGQTNKFVEARLSALFQSIFIAGYSKPL